MTTTTTDRRAGDDRRALPERPCVERVNGGPCVAFAEPQRDLCAAHRQLHEQRDRQHAITTAVSAWKARGEVHARALVEARGYVWDDLVPLIRERVEAARPRSGAR